MTNLKKLVAAGMAGVILLLGMVAYSVLRTPAEASAPITAIPLAEATVAASSQTVMAQETTVTSSQTATAQETTAASGQTVTAQEAPASSGAIVARIVPEESEARFIIDEVLNDAPKTVVGTTNQVAGELQVDPNDPAQSRIGTIQINARTLTTDNDFRNRAIKNRILFTDQYEFITFTPTRLEGLPASGTAGQSYTFKVTGNLTIRDVTKEVTFDVTATPESETRLKGTASTTIRYADYGITIPSVRQVASVDEELRLELDFVATAS